MFIACKFLPIVSTLFRRSEKTFAFVPLGELAKNYQTSKSKSLTWHLIVSIYTNLHALTGKVLQT